VIGDRLIGNHRRSLGKLDPSFSSGRNLMIVVIAASDCLRQAGSMNAEKKLSGSGVEVSNA
jgi:hypothetical protein